MRRQGPPRRDRSDSSRSRRSTAKLRIPSTKSLLLLPLLACACELIDAGPAQGIPSRCVVSTDFFVSDIHPKILEAHDCAKGGCHEEGSSGSLFVLKDVSGDLTPAAGEPLATWSEAWQFNFEQTSAQITDCDIAELSPLYSKPAGGDTQPHEGGDNFAAGGEELELIQTWLTSAD